ncbi:TraR/DksA C4-type zinc finger protein [Nitrosospira sp. NpAV]|uniref:TraR/DksA C4-type zinc finger protein n=1 Tax=Nitrosospira sp. NpAV TaxID=58133 RepID=UPI00059F4146|nr:hypothetical protein SQ11_05675 [Nitrosospira sp. NpAV]
MDFYDRAQALEQAERENILARQRAGAKARDKPSLTHCEDCGLKIPKARRLTGRGITRCIGCQQAHEYQNKHRGGR